MCKHQSTATAVLLYAAPRNASAHETCTALRHSSHASHSPQVQQPQHPQQPRGRRAHLGRLAQRLRQGLLQKHCNVQRIGEVRLKTLRSAGDCWPGEQPACGRPPSSHTAGR